MAPVRARLAELAPGVELLENLRFDPGEEGNDPAFVARLVDGHRRLRRRRVRRRAPRPRLDRRPAADAAVSAAGRLLAKEVEVLLGLRDHPTRPFVAVLGGAKVSDKLGVIDALLGIVDALVIGGGDVLHVPRRAGALDRRLAVRARQVDTCRRLLDSGKAIHLPTDIVGPGARRPGRHVRHAHSPTDGRASTSARAAPPSSPTSILDASTVFWNGPMGVFEDERFAAGTRADRAGGGRHARRSRWSAVATARPRSREFGLADDVDHVSTGGGASLELLELGDLPGLAALRKRRTRRRRVTPNALTRASR